MKTRLIPVIGVLLVASLSFADTKTEVQQKLDAFCIAFMKLDSKALERVIKASFGSDFQFVPMKGKPQGFTEWSSKEISQVKLIQKVSAMAYRIDSIKESKGVAVMHATLSFSGMMKMQSGKGGTPLAFSAKGTITAKRRNKKWMISEVREMSGSATSNGKPLKG